MLVAVYGSWYTNKRGVSRGGFSSKGTKAGFQTAGRQLGQVLGQLGRTLIITSLSAHTIDRHIADGYVDWLLRHKRRRSTEYPPMLYIRFDRRQSDEAYDASERRYSEIFAKHPRFITAEWAQRTLRFNRHLTGLEKADAVVVVGGADHTFMAGQVALLARKPLIPIAAFGGAGEMLLREILPKTEDPVRRTLLGRLTGPWSTGVRATAKELLSSFPVALIHGHGNDWQIVRDIVQNASDRNDMFIPRVMKEIVGGAEALADKWEAVAGDAHAAIAVITPDDRGRAVARRGMAARARQNVWLESGWVWGELGRKNLLLLIRGHVDIPSDFHGLEYHTYQKTPRELEVEIRAFLRRLSGAPREERP